MLDDSLSGLTMAETYCFVDESINTRIGATIIAVVTVRGAVDDLYLACEEIERRSGKGRVKWGKARWNSRVNYFHQIEADARFRDSLFYSICVGSLSVHEAAVQAIASAIERSHGVGVDVRDHVTVLVDALSKQKRHEYRIALSRGGLRIHKVRGVTSDENNSLIRLADSLAGLVNDAAGATNEDAKRLLARIEHGGIARKL
jgi:hypothetical protein